MAPPDCLTGRVFPINTAPIDAEDDYPALLAAVQAAGKGPDKPLLVNLEARITYPPPGHAPQLPQLSVLRFNASFPGKSCSPPAPAADLTNTYWRIDTLMGTAVPHLPNVREAHLILLGAESEGYVATVGCNRLV